MNECIHDDDPTVCPPCQTAAGTPSGYRDPVDVTACRWCGCPVRWVRTVNDRPMPLDPEPTDEGNVRLVGNLAHVVPGRTLKTVRRDPQVLLYRAHFATCPTPGGIR